MTNSSEIWCIREWLVLAFYVWATKKLATSEKLYKLFFWRIFNGIFLEFSSSFLRVLRCCCWLLFQLLFDTLENSISISLRCCCFQTQVRILDDNYTKWNRKHHWIIMKRNRSRKNTTTKSFSFSQWALQHSTESIGVCLHHVDRFDRWCSFFCCFRFQATIECSAGFAWMKFLSIRLVVCALFFIFIQTFLYFFLLFVAELQFSLYDGRRAYIRSAIHTTPLAKSQSKRVRRKITLRRRVGVVDEMKRNNKK